jgi:hypothetical protein
MTVLAWEARPLEERVSLNPAFLALLIRESARGFHAEGGQAMPVPLTFITLPLVLHRLSREALPRQVRTSLPIWIQEHPFLRQGFPSRARAVAPAGREALVFALRSSVVHIADAGLLVGDEPRTPRRGTVESRGVLARAYFVGRWLAHAGDTATIFYLCGIRP